jgi:hypothetical protein
MARPQLVKVVDGRQGVGLWLEVRRRANNSSPKKEASYEVTGRGMHNREIFI